ncbi:MAG: SIS domain-containing protein [Deltaproteobacteria bacterium]|nr:SIS domain-containing protein [Deltaproteobacteria bacterium]
MSEYAKQYLEEAGRITASIDPKAVENMVRIIQRIRTDGGRLFFVGVGGGAGNANHAVNDFRKIAGLECYTPTDNVSELTALVNDEGWDGVFARWLKTSRLGPKDGVFVFSVGGGNVEKQISVNIVQALKLAQEVGAKVLGVVGRDGGYTAQVGDAVIIIPTVNQATITPHTEAFQAVVWHMVVSHPDILQNEMKWESVK